eukprot:TRINITY_DN13467_c0_g2_i1.p1 TRINITY_DN13467_c0_g2~~TRINITY_DN13467_c0_g2_i1.p1  ORF type:complete len:121 (+),score=34.74 TRINITY_DN13467_c0_g2_i1:66-428(+)
MCIRDSFRGGLEDKFLKNLEFSSLSSDIKATDSPLRIHEILPNGEEVIRAMNVYSLLFNEQSFNNYLNRALVPLKKYRKGCEVLLRKYNFEGEEFGQLEEELIALTEEYKDPQIEDEDII